MSLRLPSAGNLSERVAVERLGAQLGRLRVAREGHRQVELGQEAAKDLLDARLAGERETPDPWAAQEHGIGSQSKRAESIGARADARVEQDREVRADLVRDGPERIDRRDRSVHLAPTMVGDDDAVNTALAGLDGVVGVKDALDQYRE